MRLRDGREVKLRLIRRNDRGLLADFEDGLSLQSRYQRYFSTRRVLPDELDRLTHIDYARDMTGIATAGRGQLEQQVGMVRYVRDDVGQDCDIAIAIADAWQHQGIGEQLLRAILRIAATTRVRTAHAITLSTNYGMIRLARKIGFLSQRDPKDATITQLSKKL